MKKRKWILPLAIAAVVVVIIALTCRVTFIPDPVKETMVNDKGETVVVEALTYPQQYCEDNWETKIIPTIKERAVDAARLVSDVYQDKNAAGEAYGNRANETSPWSFCVTGQVKVLGIENADKKSKTQLLLDVMPYDGEPDMKMHFGTVFSSNIKNAVRDGVGFLKLDDFANQVEFADLTTAFDKKIKATIYDQYDVTQLEGKELSFYGCVSLQDVSLDTLVILPVELNVLS